MNVIPATSEVSRYKVAKALLFEGLTMVHVVRGRKGVELPSVCNTPVVHLNFSYRFGLSDFEVDESGIRASLSFGGVPHWCDLPWDAVVGISSTVTDQFFIWIDCFSSTELETMLPPDMLAAYASTRGEKVSIFDEIPELLAFAADDPSEVESTSSEKAMIRTTKTTNRMHTDRFDSFDRATCNTGGLCFGAHVQGISLRSHRFGRIKGRRV